MRKIRRSLVALGVVAGVSLGGCAPVVVGTGPGLSLGLSPASGLSFSNCSALGWQSPQAAQLGGMSAAIQARGFMNRISALQSRFSLGYANARQDPATWKQAASGECH